MRVSVYYAHIGKTYTYIAERQRATGSLHISHYFLVHATSKSSTDRYFSASIAQLEQI